MSQQSQNSEASGTKLVPGKNGGMLKQGNPGNKGGHGNPKAMIRELALKAINEQGAKDLVRIAQGKGRKVKIGNVSKEIIPTFKDRIAAWGKLGDWSGLNSSEINVLTADGARMLDLVFSVLARECSPEEFQRLAEAIGAAAEQLDGPTPGSTK